MCIYLGNDGFDTLFCLLVDVVVEFDQIKVHVCSHFYNISHFKLIAVVLVDQTIGTFAQHFVCFEICY